MRLTWLLALPFAFIAFAPPLHAQLQPGEIDKSRGEEYQIGQRQRWFIESRGLDQVDRPDLYRAQAVAELARLTQVPMRGSFALWHPLGPATQTMFSWDMGRVTGRVQALEVHPADENILWLGTASGGVWKTLDGGLNWIPLTDSIGTQTVGSLHVEPANPDRVWLGTGEKSTNCAGYFGIGLYLSEDGGQNWQARNGSGGGSLQLSWITSVVTRPDQPGTVFAGGTGWCDANGSAQSGGLYRSLDGGASWTRLLTGLLYDIVFDPTDPNTIYAGFGSSMGVWKSTDGGEEWTQLSNGISYSTSRLRVALAPSDPQVVYVLQGDPLYRSSNGGASFSLVNSDACEGQCSYNLTLDVHPSNPDELLVGTIRHARSTDGGQSLQIMTAGWGSAQQVHQDTHVVRYSRNDPERFWVGTDGGLWRSDDGGSSYANLNSNVDSVQFYDIAVHPHDPTRVFGGAQDNSSSGRFDDQVWNVTRVTGDGMLNLVVPDSPQIVVQAGYPSGGFPSVHRSMNGGSPGSLSTIPTTGLVSGGFPWVTPLAVSPTHHAHPGTIFVASTRLWRGLASAPNAGWSWTQVTTNAFSGTVVVVEPWIDGTSRLGTYVGTSNGLFYGCADVHSQQGCSSRSAGLPGGRAITDIAVDRNDSNRIFLTRSDFQGPRLYGSTDGGLNWSALGTGLPNVPANSVVIAPWQDQRILVGTDVGVYLSEDSGASFIPFNDGMPIGNVVVDLELVPSRDTVVAGSYGRGAWLLRLSDTLMRDEFE
jgi:photosystem II stability/assembly factor-like uncharacterized protein